MIKTCCLPGLSLQLSPARAIEPAATQQLPGQRAFRGNWKPLCHCLCSGSALATLDWWRSKEPKCFSTPPTSCSQPKERRTVHLPWFPHTHHYASPDKESLAWACSTDPPHPTEGLLTCISLGQRLRETNKRPLATINHC